MASWRCRSGSTVLSSWRSGSGSPTTRSEACVRHSESARIVHSPDPVELPVLRLSLVTLGDPNQQTGGHRYHRKIARAAPGYGAEIRFCSIPDRSWPLPIATAARTLRAASARSDAIVLDGLGAAFVAPWIARQPVPSIAVL